MRRRPPRSTRTDPLFPYPTPFLSGSTSQAAMPATPTRNRTTPTRNDLSFFMTGFLVVAASEAGQCVDDVQPHRPHRRQYADQQESRSEEHTSELQSLMRTSYSVLCLQKKTQRESSKITRKHH